MVKKTDTPKIKSADKFDIASNSKETILLVALELFAQKGYAETKVQDIVKKANINLSMISYYFGGKEGLYIACLEKAATNGSESVERLLASPKTIEEFKVRLEIFIEEILIFNMTNEHAITLLKKEFSCPSTHAIKSFVENSFPRLINTISSFFKTAQKNKIIRPDINTQYLALTVMGAISNIGYEKEFVKLMVDESISNPKFRNTIAQYMVEMLSPFFVSNK